MMEGDYRTAQATVEFIVPADCSLLGQIWIGRRLHMIEENPEQHPWMYRAIVRKSDNAMIGYTSFHHKAPDPDLVEYSDLAAAELGYTIELAYRRQGYAKESAIAMMQWAYRLHGLETFFLSIGHENIPSLTMAESLNFIKISERMDELDGLEFVFKATIEDIPNRMIPLRQSVNPPAAA